MASSSEQEAAQRFIREVWGLQGVAYLMLGLRYYTRIQTQGWRKLAWDDFIMLLAVITYTCESIAAYMVVASWKGLANNAMTDAERAALKPKSPEWVLRVNGSKTHVVGLLLYATLLWLLKGCWVVYYARLTEVVQNMRRLILGAVIIMPITYLACLLVAFLKCIPFDHQWQINPSPGNHCMPAISSIQTIFVMMMNTATDFYLMAIPLPMVWKSNLPMRKKLTLLVMFSGGFLEMAFGIMRCVSILTLGDIDPAQSGYWSVRESFVSFVLTNMPMVYPLVKKYINKGREYSHSKSGSNTDGSQRHSLNSCPLRSNAGSKNSNSILVEKTWEVSDSKEHIVEPDRDQKSTLSAELDGSGKTLDIHQHSNSGGGGYPMQNNVASARMHSPTCGMFENVGQTGRSRSRDRNPRRDHNHQIVVTREYTIRDSGPSPELPADPGRAYRF